MTLPSPSTRLIPTEREIRGYGEAVWLGNCESGLTNGTTCESGDKAGSTIWLPTVCPNLWSYQFSPCLQELVCHVKRRR